MIYLYTGTPGSGKSLHLAEAIYKSLRKGQPVIANFEIATQSIKKKKGQELPFLYSSNLALSPGLCVDAAREYFSGSRPRESELLLCIDEAQILFNSRNWQDKKRLEWLEFFTQHRKYGYDVILVAQYDEMLDKQIRALIEYEIKHRKASNFGLFGRIISLFGMGKLFCKIRYWYPIQERVGSEWFRAKKKYYSLYDTFGDFEKLK